MLLSTAVQMFVMAEETASLSIQEVGRRGGLSRARNLSPERRHEIARRAAEARWGKKAGAPTPDPNDPKGPNREPGADGSVITLKARRPSASVASDHLNGSSRAASA